VKRFLAILVVCGFLVGCDPCDPFEKSSPYPPEVPPHHPDHDINKQPHEWDNNGKGSNVKVEDNAAITAESEPNPRDD